MATHPLGFAYSKSRGSFSLYLSISEHSHVNQILFSFVALCQLFFVKSATQPYGSNKMDQNKSKSTKTKPTTIDPVISANGNTFTKDGDGKVHCNDCDISLGPKHAGDLNVHLNCKSHTQIANTTPVGELSKKETHRYQEFIEKCKYLVIDGKNLKCSVCDDPPFEYNEIFKSGSKENATIKKIRRHGSTQRHTTNVEVLNGIDQEEKKRKAKCDEVKYCFLNMLIKLLIIDYTK